MDCGGNQWASFSASDDILGCWNSLLPVQTDTGQRGGIAGAVRLTGNTEN